MKWLILTISFLLCFQVGAQDKVKYTGSYSSVKLSKETVGIDEEYSIGDRWIYERVHYPAGGGPYREVLYAVTTILDTVFDGSHLKYILGEQDTFYIENNKMYFWDYHFQEYIMYYDWDAATSYEIKYFAYGTGKEKVATVVIDSISYKYFGNDSLQVQHVHILNNGSFESYYEKIYEGIGPAHYGIKFYLGKGLVDNYFDYITKLRCFSADSLTYKFVSYPCDSTWNTVSTIDVNKFNIKVFPNPTTGTIYIEGLKKPIKYNIYNLTGRLIQSGRTNGNEIYIEKSGVIILEMRIGKTWIRKKIVIIE